MNRKHIFTVLIICLALRLIAFFLANPFNITEYDRRFNIADAKNYMIIASNIYFHSEYSLSDTEPFIPNSLITPGYPFFLYLIFLLSGSPNFIFTIIIQIILNLVSAFVMMKIGDKISKYFKLNNPYLPLYCGLLFALEPILISVNVITLTENIFIPLLIFSVLYLINILMEPDKNINWILFGILLGIGILIRPAFIPVLPVFIFIFLWVGYREKKFKSIMVKTALSAVILLIVISPWIIRNKITFNEWGLTTLGPYSVYVTHIALLESKKQHISEEAAVDSLIKNISMPKTGLDFEVSDRISSEIFNYFVNNPGPFIKYWIISCAKLLVQPGTQHIARLTGIGSARYIDIALKETESKNLFSILNNYFKDSFYLTFYWIYHIIYIMFFYAAIFYLFLKKNSYRSDPLIISLLLSAAIILIFSSLVQSVRYRIPVFILLIPVSSIFIHNVILTIYNNIMLLKRKLIHVFK